MADFEYILQPGIFSAPDVPGADLQMFLEKIWVSSPADVTFYVASGFVDQNGVLPFVKTFKQHVDGGGQVRCFFAGSAGQNMAGQQAVEELLSVGAEVALLNRRKIFHVKMYGCHSSSGEESVLSSGNFTGNGLALNVESSARFGRRPLSDAGFSWQTWEDRLRAAFDWHKLSLGDRAAPGWKLTYDETHGRVGAPEDDAAEESASEVLVFTLSKIDVARIQDPDYRGTQYFWLSRYTVGFFPPLVNRNRPGAKKTFSTDVNVDFVNVGVVQDVSVTFEAYNNLDFRLGTGPLRKTKIAKEGDLAVLQRLGDKNYRLKVLNAKSREALRLLPYLINFIGARGKRYAFVPTRLVSGVF
ncbi:MAG: restriction endonuclease [Thermoplasmata archaeon]